jgi:hypothetical protein
LTGGRTGLVVATGADGDVTGAAVGGKTGGMAVGAWGCATMGMGVPMGGGALMSETTAVSFGHVLLKSSLKKKRKHPRARRVTGIEFRDLVHIGTIDLLGHVFPRVQAVQAQDTISHRTRGTGHPVHRELTRKQAPVGK